MSRKDEKAYSMKMDALTVQACHHLLSNTSVHTRGETRIHASIFKQVKKKGMTFVDPFRGAYKEEGGTIELTVTQAKFLKEAHDKLCETKEGFPGVMSEGAGDLYDLIEDVESMHVADTKKNKEMDHGKTPA